MKIKNLDQKTFHLGEEEVVGKKILEKFKPEHVVVYYIDDDEALTFSDMGTNLDKICKEFPEWLPNPGAYIDMYMMYKDNVLCIAGLEEHAELLETQNDVYPITPEMNHCRRVADEYIEFWKANKNLK